MAKRTRGSTRPGQRRPIQRTARPATPAPPRVRPPSLTAEEEARAAELEAKILEEEREAERTQQRARERGQRVTQREPALRATAPLAVRAADEYAYVARDVRRIAIIATGLLAIMFGLWVALQATSTGAV
jgi:hypothetical protein